MRSKVGIFALFALFTSFLLFRVVDDDGAGGGVSDDIGDFEIEDKVEESSEATEKPKEAEALEDEEIKALKEKNERNSKWIEEQQAMIATTQAIEELTGKYSDFDANKIAEHLATVAKEQGEEEAEKLNNPLGWENIYLTKFKVEKVDTPNFDRGRGESKEPLDYNKTIAAARDGDSNAKKDLFRNSKGRQ